MSAEGVRGDPEGQAGFTQAALGSQGSATGVFFSRIGQVWDDSDVSIW